MTLRDHYKERAESAASNSSAMSYSPRFSGFSQPSDDWAFEFINAKYLQPIMEAFDDDGSGYVTYQEVNDFVDERPASLGWSLPHWVAYWAVGWQITAGRYRDRIMGLFSHMFSMRPQIKAENRYWVDYYLRSVWPVAFELTQSLRPANVSEHIEDKFAAFAEFEEERIRKNLEDIHYDIDALDTVYVVSGPGRIEKVRNFTLHRYVNANVSLCSISSRSCTCSSSETSHVSRWPRPESFTRKSFSMQPTAYSGS